LAVSPWALHSGGYGNCRRFIQGVPLLHSPAEELGATQHYQEMRWGMQSQVSHEKHAGRKYGQSCHTFVCQLAIFHMETLVDGATNEDIPGHYDDQRNRNQTPDASSDDDLDPIAVDCRGQRFPDFRQNAEATCRPHTHSSQRIVHEGVECGFPPVQAAAERLQLTGALSAFQIIEDVLAEAGGKHGSNRPDDDGGALCDAVREQINKEESNAKTT